MKQGTTKKNFMRNARTVNFSRLFGKTGASTGRAFRRDGEGRLVVPLYSKLFSSLTENVMCTNAMFESFKEEIEDSIALYPAKERISLMIYESSEAADDSVREIVLIGFKKYITQYKEKSVAQLKLNALTFLGIAVIGILLEYFLYSVFPDAFSEWIYSLLDITATVLIWEFVAFLAFEFTKEVAAIRRLSQILDIKFIFRHWE